MVLKLTQLVSTRIEEGEDGYRTMGKSEMHVCEKIITEKNLKIQNSIGYVWACAHAYT